LRREFCASALSPKTDAAASQPPRGIVKELWVAAGKIICISSVHEVIPWSTHANYAASKGGIMIAVSGVLHRRLSAAILMER